MFCNIGLKWVIDYKGLGQQKRDKIVEWKKGFENSS